MEYETSSACDANDSGLKGRLIIDKEKLAILKSFFTTKNMD